MYDGEKVIYRCAGGKHRSYDCPAQLYLMFYVDNDKVSIFGMDAQHANHNDIPNRGLPLKFDNRSCLRKVFVEIKIRASKE